MIGKACVVALALVGSLGPLVVAPAAAQDKPRLAVLSFENTTAWWGQQLGASAADQLTVKLVNSGAFTMLERERIDAILAEQSLGQSGAITPSQVVKLGKLMGVEYLVTGRLVHFDIRHQRGRVGIPGIGRSVGGSRTRAEASMNVRVFSTTTGEIVAAAEGKGDDSLGGGLSIPGLDISSISEASPWNPTVADRALAPAVDQIVADLVRRKNLFTSTAAAAAAELSTRVPNIAGLAADGSVYIDVGQNGGMTVGRRFNVMRIVDTIKDANGNVLDNITEQVAVIEVSRVLSQSSICKVIQGKPGAKDVLQPAK